jgi:hypothetical protein
VDCINLAQDRDNWQAVVNIAIKKFGFFSGPAVELLASEEGLCCIEIVI